jgi:hypothetical protein
MSVRNWLRNRTTRPASRPTIRPRLTRLEDRTVPSFGWAAGVGGAGNAVATDSAGDAYVTGSFSGSFTPAGSSVPLMSAGSNDIFVSKYSRSGAFQWAVSLGGAGDDNGSGIAVDSAGSMAYVVGQFAGGYVAQLNAATGAMNWSRTVAGTSADAVAVGGSGVAYVTSQSSGGGIRSRYVTKLDAGGAQQWQDTITSQAGIDGRGASVAVSGNTVYVGGTFVTSATFAIGSGSYSFTTQTNYTAGYVLKLGSDNTYGWVQTFQNRNGHVLRNTIAADASGNVYAFGEFAGKITFGASTTLNANNGVSDYVTKLTPAGSVAWAKKFGPVPIERSVGSITVDGAGSVYLTGAFSGTTDFNPGTGTFNLTSAGGTDAFVLKLDTNGAFQWAVRAGTAGDDTGTGIAVNGFGEVYVTGRIAAGTVDFDPANPYLDSRDLLTGPGGFLWQIVQP